MYVVQFRKCLPSLVIYPAEFWSEKQLHFGVKAEENQDKVPTLYWLLKLRKKPYKARFIATSSSCTTTELPKLLTLCLTAVKNMLSSTVNRYTRDPVKNYFGLLKIQVKF